MKKLILSGFLAISALIGFSQTTTKLGTSTNYVEIKNRLQIDGMTNNSTEDSSLVIDHLTHKVKNKLIAGGGGSGIDQAYADAHYMPLVTPLTAYNRDFGILINTVAQGNDSRILDGETAFGYGNHATVGYYKAANFVAGVNYLTPTGSASGLTGILPLSSGGLGFSAGNLQQLLDGIFPSQGGQAGKVWTTDGTHGGWQAPAAGGGTGITGISVASTNGINGSTTAGATPVITIGTALNGLIKGNGTGFLAAIEGTDFLSPNSNIAWNKILSVPAFLLANQTITFTPTGGDITGSTSGSTSLQPTLTINNNSVTLVKLQQVAQNHIFFRSTAGTGNFEDHLISDLKPILQIDQVNNTSDANKPVSAAQAAINATFLPINNPTPTGTVTIPRTTNVTLQTDTIPQFVFGGGSGINNDTLWVDNTATYGDVYNDGSNAVKVTKINFILRGSSPTLTVTIKYGPTLNSGGTELVTGGTVVTNTTTGQNVTVLTNATIPTGNYVWCSSPTVTVGSKPTYLSVTVIGTKIRN